MLKSGVDADGYVRLRIYDEDALMSLPIQIPEQHSMSNVIFRRTRQKQRCTALV